MNNKTDKTKYLNLILFILISIWLVLIYFSFLSVYLPFLSILNPFLKKMFSLVCHQENSKVYSCCGNSTFVCFRCLGLYWGAFFASIVTFFNRNLYLKNRRIYFFAALCFIIIDVLSVKIYLYSYNFYIAFLTGMLLGFISFLYLYKSIFEQISENSTLNE